MSEEKAKADEAADSKPEAEAEPAAQDAEPAVKEASHIVQARNELANAVALGQDTTAPVKRLDAAGIDGEEALEQAQLANEIATAGTVRTPPAEAPVQTTRETAAANRAAAAGESKLGASGPPAGRSTKPNSAT